ncbi:hypothetical protein [Burkholderia cepacia]|uniref:hypothetical protein n=1 Tax=Burkholderia cepacia TaxID=292 RepID=UPI002AB779CB|nr:hypothetical protein [Burkholderia cepacia]
MEIKGTPTLHSPSSLWDAHDGHWWLAYLGMRQFPHELTGFKERLSEERLSGRQDRSTALYDLKQWLMSTEF